MVPRGSKHPIFVAFETRVHKYWLLGPSGVGRPISMVANPKAPCSAIVYTCVLKVLAYHSFGGLCIYHRTKWSLRESRLWTATVSRVSWWEAGRQDPHAVGDLEQAALNSAAATSCSSAETPKSPKYPNVWYLWVLHWESHAWLEVYT